MEIVLASASPRRSMLLQQIGLDFTIVPSQIEENAKDVHQPLVWVQEIALAKAQNVANNVKDSLVIGADTIVLNNKLILGKPANEKEAREMLRSLSGKTHQVITGIAIIDSNNLDNFLSEVEITQVTFRKISEEEIEAYLQTGEPFDKAGAYGIQGLGAVFVEGIQGCYFNVVGLPLNRLAQGLKNFGVEVLP